MASTQEHNCVFCSETFADKETLQQHFRKHGDPKFSSSIKKSSDEISNEKQNTDLVSCDVCTEKFQTISKAITHKHKAHPDHDAKYFCSWCGKLFTLKFLYSKHEVTHESTLKSSGNVYPCDVCNVEFHVPSAMIYHNKFFHRQDAELLAIGHSKKQRFIDQELFPLYYCPFCGDENINKVNLHKHIEDDHSDENQSPDEVLKCPLCEAIFYHLDAYQIHLTFHSTEDVYNGQNVDNDYNTEFSLETAPPIIEKVGDLDVDPNSEVMDLDQLLTVAMMESQDSDKPKKKKKHKKSKKETITLDEFLNMNKDVFGEEVDVHGIEEVPSKMIAKRLKTGEKPQPQNKLKVVTKPDMERLKQQGVIIKLTPTTKPKNFCGNKSGFVVGKPFNTSKMAIGSTPSSTSFKAPTTSSDDIITRLMNKNNQQITLKKKPTETYPDIQHADKPDIVIKPIIGDNLTQNNDLNMSNTPERLEVECDPFPKDSSEVYTDSEIQSPKMDNNDWENSSDENMTQLNTVDNGELDLDNLITKSTIDVNKIKHNESNQTSNNLVDKMVNIDMNGQGATNISTDDQAKHITDFNVSNKTNVSNVDSIQSAHSLNILKNLGITVKTNKKPEACQDKYNPHDGNINGSDTSKSVSEEISITSNPYKDTPSKVINDSINKISKNTDLKHNIDKTAHCLIKLSETINVKNPNSEFSTHSESEQMQDIVNEGGNDDGDEDIPSDFDASNDDDDGDNVDSKKTKNTCVPVNDSHCTNANFHNDSDQSENENQINVIPQAGVPINISKKLQHTGLTVKSTTSAPNKINAESKECTKINKPLDTLKNLQHLTIKPVQQVSTISGNLNNLTETKSPSIITTDKNYKIAAQSLQNRQVVNKILYSKEGCLQKNTVFKQEIQMKKMEIQCEQTTSGNEMSDDFSDDDFESLDNKTQNDERPVRIKILNRMQDIQNKSEINKILHPTTEKKTEVKQDMKQFLNMEETVAGRECVIEKKSSLTGVLNNLNKFLTVKPLSLQSKVTVEPEVYNIDDSDSEDAGKEVDNKNMIDKPVQKDCGISEIVEKPNKAQQPISQAVKLNSLPRISPKHKLYKNLEDRQCEPNTKLMKTDASQSNISKILHNKNMSIKNNVLHGEVIQNSINKSVNSCKMSSDNDDDFFGISGDDEMFTDEDEPLNAIEANNKSVNLVTPRSKNNITLENFNDSESEEEHKNCADESFNEGSLDCTNQDILNKLNSNLNISIKSKNREASSSSVPVKPITMKSNIPTKQLVQSNKIINNDNCENRVIQQRTNQQHAADKSSASTVSQHVTKSVKTIQRQTIVEEVTTTVTRTIKTVNQEVSTSSSQQIINKTITGPRMHNTRPQMRPTFRSPMPAGMQRAVRQPVWPRVAHMNQPRSSGTPPAPSTSTQVMPRQTAIRQIRPLPKAIQNNMGNMRLQNSSPIRPNVQVTPFKKFNAPAPRFGPGGPRGAAPAGNSCEVRRVNVSASETVQSGAGGSRVRSTYSSTHESSSVSRAGPAPGPAAAAAAAGGALAAIQRLQAQGLLVKKPRIDFPDEEEDHFSASDEDFDNDMPQEYDE